MIEVQYLTDAEGNRTHVVVEIGLFNRLAASADIPEQWEDIPYEAGENDSETIPTEVVGISIKKGVTLLAAWRIHRNMSQKEAADALGITQAGISKIEKSERPHAATLEKFAKLYDCRPEQLTTA
ncbi:helix-turn-helix domain-containing protein [Nissabacter sp. SGAir0207]|uniref:helix-turn-helix domain-containing protein n=1 Tax=Nissabacter sp. SGAir0207 TaxID=2126321 RepID=UPI0010CD1204|nr:helix-turn-helix transcriptional regulator [Nissabacter sp. SGAir0207]QCR38712.1 transcriptional regulator [Nissabacter sp. SGAir0207]